MKREMNKIAIRIAIAGHMALKLSSRGSLFNLRFLMDIYLSLLHRRFFIVVILSHAQVFAYRLGPDISFYFIYSLYP